MLPLGHNAEREGSPGLRFVLRGSIGKNAGQIGHLGNQRPSASRSSSNTSRLRQAILAGCGTREVRTTPGMLQAQS
jgi:hypothetical protein